MSERGALLCARYAASPNFYGYCGPDKNVVIVQHLQEQREDGEVASVLTEFETLFPYLEIIAKKNGCTDCLDHRVVEAYWIGNDLLRGFTQSEYKAFLREKLRLEYKLKRDDFTSVMERVHDLAPLPFHTFHVLNIFKRTAHQISSHMLQTMESCRINVGTIISLEKEHTALVLAPVLSSEADGLKLTSPSLQTISLRYGKRAVVKDLRVGEWVSFHWGLICDRLTVSQVKQLDFYTRLSIRLANT